METVKNLTDPIDIRFAIEKKYGARGSVNALAHLIGTQPSVISQHINKHRNNKNILQGIADFIGCSVHGVEPSAHDEMSSSSNCTGQNTKNTPSSGHNTGVVGGTADNVPEGGITLQVKTER